MSTKSRSTSSGAPPLKATRKVKMARHSLMVAIAKIHNQTDDQPAAEKIQPLLDIWYRAIDEAKNGNMQAANMIMDRLDGKPTETVDLVADVANRNAGDLSDEELLSIARGCSRRDSEEAQSSDEPVEFY